MQDERGRQPEELHVAGAAADPSAGRVGAEVPGVY